MYITIAVLVGFLLLFFGLMYFFPGKLEKNIPEEAGEVQLFEAEGLNITRVPAIGPRKTAYPGAKLRITNKRIIITQKALATSDLVVREIMLNDKALNQALSGQKNWGNVLVAPVNYDSAFSVKGEMLILKNPNAINLDRFEIRGIPIPQNVLEAVKKVE